MLKGLVESCRRKYSCSTADDIVHHLRQNNPNYRRMELKTLTRLVNEILQPPSSLSPSPHKRKIPFDMQDEDDRGPVSSHRRKKPGWRADNGDDDGEERLLQIEKEYSRRRNCDQATISTSESDSESESESQSTPSSTSEDAVFGERVEPEFDLTRSMLRQRYSTESKKERNIEVDVSTEKDSNTLDMVNRHKENVGGEGGARRGKVEKVVGAKKEDKEGPRFEDLGGMRGVLEELEMEVFVPLFHPHVLQRLGVNPISGILLHGPPGCGKTKLAHAIANEMGIPFYKISATEVVSGVSGIVKKKNTYLDFILCA